MFFFQSDNAFFRSLPPGSCWLFQMFLSGKPTYENYAHTRSLRKRKTNRVQIWHTSRKTQYPTTNKCGYMGKLWQQKAGPRVWLGRRAGNDHIFINRNDISSLDGLYRRRRRKPAWTIIHIIPWPISISILHFIFLSCTRAVGTQLLHCDILIRASVGVFRLTIEFFMQRFVGRCGQIRTDKLGWVGLHESSVAVIENSYLNASSLGAFFLLYGVL